MAASITWTAPFAGANNGTYGLSFPDAPGDVRMMNGYLDPANGTMPATIVVSGLPASLITGGYDVYAYFTGAINAGMTTRTYKYTIGTTSYTVSQTAPSPTTFPGYTLATNMGTTGNYLVFANVTGASFTLTTTPVSGSPQRAPINGLQVVFK